MLLTRTGCWQTLAMGPGLVGQDSGAGRSGPAPGPDHGNGSGGPGPGSQPPQSMVLGQGSGGQGGRSQASAAAPVSPAEPWWLARGATRLRQGDSDKATQTRRLRQGDSDKATQTRRPRQGDSDMATQTRRLRHGDSDILTQTRRLRQATQTRRLRQVVTVAADRRASRRAGPGGPSRTGNAPPLPPPMPEGPGALVSGRGPARPAHPAAQRRRLGPSPAARTPRKVHIFKRVRKDISSTAPKPHPLPPPSSSPTQARSHPTRTHPNPHRRPTHPRLAARYGREKNPAQPGRAAAAAAAAAGYAEPVTSG